MCHGKVGMAGGGTSGHECTVFWVFRGIMDIYISAH